MTLLDRQEARAGKPRVRLGPMARQLAEKHCHDGVVGRQSLEDGIRELREQLARAEGSAGGVVMQALQQEMDQLMGDVARVMDAHFERADAQFESIIHALNGIRFMVQFVAQAAGRTDLQSMVEGYNKAFDNEIISIQESREKLRSLQAKREEEEREQEAHRHEQDVLREADHIRPAETT